MNLTRTLGGFFERQHLQPWQYGIASSMISLLATHDNNGFRRFFDDIKHGYTWEQILQRHYQMTPIQLAAAYGQKIRIPGLKP
ncbi:MAG: hypothetical protein MK102_19780 [Fuerstiella sp.]|nr:hypothetical protein [Fuerstiella sp.]